MVLFIGRYHICAGLLALCAYLFVGAVIPLQNGEAAEKVDTTACIWYNIIIKYRRWYHG